MSTWYRPWPDLLTTWVHQCKNNDRSELICWTMWPRRNMNVSHLHHIYENSPGGHSTSSSSAWVGTCTLQLLLMNTHLVTSSHVCMCDVHVSLSVKWSKQRWWKLLSSHSRTNQWFTQGYEHLHLNASTFTLMFVSISLSCTWKRSVSRFKNSVLLDLIKTDVMFFKPFCPVLFISTL